MQSPKQHGSLGKHYQIIHRSNAPLSLWLISLRALGQQTAETNTFQDRCQLLISILKLQQSSIYLLRHIFSACGHYCLEVLELNWSMLTISVVKWQYTGTLGYSNPPATRMESYGLLDWTRMVFHSLRSPFPKTLNVWRMEPLVCPLFCPSMKSEMAQIQWSDSDSTVWTVVTHDHFISRSFSS